MQQHRKKKSQRIEAYRLFFPLAALHAAISIPLWLAIRSGFFDTPQVLTPSLWHAQEMIFGYVLAVIAGYLLPPLPATKLLGLGALWIAGRLVWFNDNSVPLTVVVVLAMAFPITLAGIGSMRFRVAKRLRNHVFTLILLGLGSAAATLYIAASKQFLGSAYGAYSVALNLIILFIIIMGGRLIPTATVGALRDSGVEVSIRFQPYYESLSIVVVFILMLLQLSPTPDYWPGYLSLVLAMILILRILSWHSIQTWKLVEIWPLHLAYAWIAMGFVLFGLAKIGHWWNPLDALHAVTIGGVGTMTLAMLIRVTRIRSRRALISPLWMVAIQSSMFISVITRLTTNLLTPNAANAFLWLSACSWSLAFLLFIIRFYPQFISPKRGRN